MDSQKKAEIAAASDRPQPVTVTLDYPFVRGERQIDQVVLTPPAGAALKGLSLSRLINEADSDEHAKLLPRISSPVINRADIDAGNLAPSDFMQIVGEVVGFFIPKAKRAEIASNG
ncbi:phage tail assembly protein [Novosphingopyxis sp. YJ-S2-01]|uniref:phage tail assembly protein n=1 Tax=Novosphingopyxis sp. YJ-S2-01 TaxID=2794021 RepID=UPI0018DBFAF7|nr:phage tail assembly protein [Novosphingopyxis sp. YJ-S2-01]MBH9537909.1 phage tail assembly protein [Novosphingopyxis sp. YJ-S2-01]